jgi:hypothetical protein
MRRKVLKELFAEAIIGRDAEEFVESDIGKYIIGCAEQEANEAMDQLKSVFPWRKRKITELQNKIWRAESLQTWLAELIVKGKQATQQLESED